MRNFAPLHRPEFDDKRLITSSVVVALRRLLADEPPATVQGLNSVRTQS